MSALLKNIILRELDSLGESASLLAHIPNDDPYPFVDFVLSKIKQKEYKALEIFDGENRIGITIYTIDHFGDYKELSSICTYVNSGKEIHRYTLDNLLVDLAKSLGCKSLRMSTVRSGLVKTALNTGWKIAEVTLRKYV